MPTLKSCSSPGSTTRSSRSSAPPWITTRWWPRAFSIAEDDEAGQDWCEEHGYPGYTSYASLTDLPWRFPIFQDDWFKALDAHVAAFARIWNSTSRSAS